MIQKYDIIIIGSGGGTKLRAASKLGKKIAIIEMGALGGTCLNRGCIPSKMLIYPGDLVTHIKEDAAKLNISLTGNIELDFEQIIRRVNTTIEADSASILPMYQNDMNVDFYAGQARFKNNSTIEVNDQTLSAEKIYIATGSRPHIPPIEGLKDTPFFTSTEALKNTKKPKKMIVIGGGYIATELGHFYGAAGVDMHFLVRSEMLKNEDKDIRKIFQDDFQKRYNLHFGVNPTQVKYENNTFYVTLKDAEGREEIMHSDALFVATGVIPNSDTLSLENTDIRISKKGYIEVDEHLMTHVPGIYALGDVVGNYLFRHSVNYEGEYLLGQHYLGDIPAPIKYPPMPHAVFTYPQIAGVGYSEDMLETQGKELGKDYQVVSHEYKKSAMGSAMRSEIGFVKLIFEPQSHKLLGAHIIGEKASDIIHMLMVYISEDIPITHALKNMIFIHPALSEVIRNAIRKI